MKPEKEMKKEMKPVDYMQTDSRWAGKRYAASGEKTTIRSAGCGITCAAMVIATLADSSVTPADTAKWSMEHGYKAYHQGTYYSYFTPQLAAYGIECHQVNVASVYHGKSQSTRSVNAAAADAVSDGDWMICCMGVGDWTRSGHFVLWYGVEDGYALILDPNSKKASRRKAPLAKFQYQVKFYFRVEVEDMTQEKFNAMMDTWLVQRGLKAPGDWSRPARDWAYEQGIMTGGAYMRPITREEACQVLYAYDKNKGKD